jgi:hypothetical protein
VEPAEIRTSGQDWWTLGFEATGPVGLLRCQLQATAAHMFAQALPGGMQPSLAHSRSYPQLFGQRPGGGYDAGPDGCPFAGPTGPAAVRVHPGWRRIQQQAGLLHCRQLAQTDSAEAARTGRSGPVLRYQSRLMTHSVPAGRSVGPPGFERPGRVGCA